VFNREADSVDKLRKVLDITSIQFGINVEMALDHALVWSQIGCLVINAFGVWSRMDPADALLVTALGSVQQLVKMLSTFLK